MKNVSKSKYYIVCPSNVVTGGPDALHQMAYYMTTQGFDCQVAYLADKKRGLQIPDPYQKYIDDFCLFKDVKDLECNHVIVPETFSFLIKKYKKAKIYVWWLSVDNNAVDFNWLERLFYLASSPIRVLKNRNLYHCSAFSKVMNTLLCKEYSFFDEKENVSHLCASYYALDIIGKKTQRKVYKCIEPISRFFLEKHEGGIAKHPRGNGILFNPKKSKCIIEKLKDQFPSLRFIPLENLSQSELIEAYTKSKLYIDFGPFPGAERIPKEAVLFGCLVITGRHGASNYYGDVPIPDEYKFADETNLEAIYSQINYCLNNYETCFGDFDDYRSTVLSLEANFIKSIHEIFDSEVCFGAE